MRGLPPTKDASIQANRQRWVDFVDNDLGQALRQYDAATTVAQRQDGLKHVHEALRSLQTRNSERPWQPSWDLQNAVNDLFNQPNLDITADVNVVSPLFDQNLVTTGPVYRKGYWSQVTAGPKTGFGLLPSDDGIFFYNSQLLTSVTPITDFQNQIASDPQGQRAGEALSVLGHQPGRGPAHGLHGPATVGPLDLAGLQPQHRRLDLLDADSGRRIRPDGRRASSA